MYECSQQTLKCYVFHYVFLAQRHQQLLQRTSLAFVSTHAMYMMCMCMCLCMDSHVVAQICLNSIHLKDAIHLPT